MTKYSYSLEIFKCLYNIWIKKVNKINNTQKNIKMKMTYQNPCNFAKIVPKEKLMVAMIVLIKNLE